MVDTSSEPISSRIDNADIVDLVPRLQHLLPTSGFQCNSQPQLKSVLFDGYIVTTTLLFRYPVAGYPSLMVVVLSLGGMQLAGHTWFNRPASR
jgi:hypothetical protein